MISLFKMTPNLSEVLPNVPKLKKTVMFEHELVMLAEFNVEESTLYIK